MVFLYTIHDVDYTLNDDLMMKMIGRDIIPPDIKKIIFLNFEFDIRFVDVHQWQAAL